MDAVCVVPSGDWCGEGPVWNAAEQSLYWVDINRFLIHRLRTRDGCVHSWFFEEPVTVLGLTTREGTLVVALASRLILWEPTTDARRDQGFHLPGWPAVRLNEGKPDPRGSMWLGTMRNNVNPDGTGGDESGTPGILYRVDPDGKVSVWKRDIGISNTMAWTPDRKRFYFADTPRNEVYVYDYDEATGDISGERPFFTGYERGLPDGSAMDTAGYLWNCRHGGKCVVRVAPDGTVDRVVEVAATRVTSCAFGGEDLKTLYVTSAGMNAPAGEQRAGSVFAIACDTAGLPENRFRV